VDGTTIPQNFEVVLQLTIPENRLKSRLLLHPLASDRGAIPRTPEGNSGNHRANPEWLMLAEWDPPRHCRAFNSGNTTNSQPRDELDFEFFKTAVQPIFLKAAASHARCYGCHTVAKQSLSSRDSLTESHRLD